MPRTARPPNAAPNPRRLLDFDLAYTAFQLTLEEALAAEGLSAARWAVLRVLREQPGASGADVARAVFVSPQAASTMLARLERAGLIERLAPAPGAGRAARLRLSAAGAALAATGDVVAARLDARLVESLGAEGALQFHALLRQCLATFRAGAGALDRLSAPRDG